MDCVLKDRLMWFALGCIQGSEKLPSFLGIVLEPAPKGLVECTWSAPGHVSERDTCACDRGVSEMVDFVERA